MGNLKHSLAATVAVTLVGVLAAIQASEIPAVGANKLAQEVNLQETEENQAPEVLKGDGEGEFLDIAPVYLANQAYIGNNIYVLTDGGSINLRAAADIESDILNVLPLGTQLKVIDIDGDWFKVEAGSLTGYVKSCYATLDFDAVKAVMLATTMYQKATVTTGVNVRSEDNEESVILSSVAEGESVIVLDEFNDWCKVYFGENYDIGYIKSEYVSVGDMVARSEINAKRNKRIAAIVKDGKIKVSSGVIDVKLMPNDDSETIVTLANGANCKIVSGGSKWTKIIVSATNEIGYVKSSNVAEVVKEVKTSSTAKKPAATTKSATAVGNGSKLVAQAAKYLGVKYVYGGSSPSGFDCSGLVQYCCRQLGVSVNRTASAQYSNGAYVSRDNLQPGDLVFFSRGGRISHVVIYAGNGMVIHAPRTGKTICYQSLSKICSYSHYVGARRVM
ncbi:MAG: C40 family peptidase [Clostridia bacterium]|nr:C40 family peptidase [Clostridia bacterium]